MSTTLEAIDPRAYLEGWMHGVVSMYASDINAIPEEKWTATFGGCTRPASKLTVDALGLVVWTTQALQGKEPVPDENLATACQTRAGSVQALKRTSDEFLAALSAADEGILTKTVMAPWGMESPVFAIAQAAASHIWYHDGQLNYIQCLLGDDKIHWMDGV